MRAKQCVARYYEYLDKKRPVYKEQPDDAEILDVDACVGVCGDLLLEARSLIDARRAKSDHAIIAIFKELDQKWRAIVRLICKEEAYYTIFRTYVKEAAPELDKALGWS